MFSARSVSLSFSGVRALAGIDLRVGEGELLGVIGPNGSGKSTLFNVMSGIYQPDSGELEFRGRMIAGMRPADIVRQGIVRTFQNKRLFSNMTVAENVMVAGLKTAPGSALGDVLGMRGSKAAAGSEIRYWTTPVVSVGKFSAAMRCCSFHDRACRSRLEGGNALL